MGYADFTRDFKFNDAVTKIQNKLINDLNEHKKSEECTGKPDCPICKDLQQSIAASDPCLP